MVLPTYPLKDVFAAELKKQIKDGRFSVKRNTKAKENVNNLLSDHFKKQISLAMARKTYPEAKPEEEDSLEEEPEDEEDDKPGETACAAPESEEEEMEEEDDDDEEGDSDDMAAAAGGGDSPAIVPIIIPIIDTKALMKPQVWGIFGDWKDLADPAGLAFLKGYERECYSYCFDVDKEEKWLRA